MVRMARYISACKNNKPMIKQPIVNIKIEAITKDLFTASRLPINNRAIIKQINKAPAVNKLIDQLISRIRLNKVSSSSAFCSQPRSSRSSFKVLALSIIRLKRLARTPKKAATLVNKKTGAIDNCTSWGILLNKVVSMVFPLFKNKAYYKQ